ncbi:polysaccharide deacetylase family protein [Pelagicoccus mobilis]|uniref:Polysaccharide deacetylase family protein n=1 Tax=Pelagicoccus mobilis TaxID=415221 RepID=A0A934RVL9_9BACT|nr:polysaccharide deacetylase family protein [Pelagicoccus mobilis]MBK1877301.1 polysaccharide deacetylase family protein [Pelagicoccus mobilis]
MDRRNFIKTSFAAAGTFSLGSIGLNAAPHKTHALSLSFDDGFKKSFYRIAEIHENYGLKACLNVIATGHLKSFNAEPKWIPQELLGDFDDWNKLNERGHEIMPHTWEHLNLTEIPVEKAKENIEKCLSYFEENLSGYNSQGAVYNFAYNASITELEDFALSKVSAVRTGGWLVLNNTMVNGFPVKELPFRLGCWGHGPGFCDDYIEQEINKFLASKGGWLILNLHGLDEEGWGPVSTIYLDTLLRRLSMIDYLTVQPTGEIVKELAKH